jgi:Flp pilus assembly protein TadD
MRYISKSLSSKGSTAEAARWALRAVAEGPGEREPLVELARVSYRARDFQTCYYASKKALEIKARPMTYICEPEAWGHEPWDYLAISAFNIGHKLEALEAAREAARLSPTDTRLSNNVLAIEKDVKS